ncbi:hypothetical protein BH11PSE3_BH11PSE3_17070 [soil metagenome]
MMQPQTHLAPDRVSAREIERLYPARVARIARGELSPAEREAINERASDIDPEWRGGSFNDLHYFYFRYPEQSAIMAGFLMRQGLHRLVPGTLTPPTPEQVEAEWMRRARQRTAILEWARTRQVTMEIVMTYRFERRQGAASYAAHRTAARIVEQTDRTIEEPMAYAGACIEWAEREYRDWFWRCAPNHQVL